MRCCGVRGDLALQFGCGARLGAITAAPATVAAFPGRATIGVARIGGALAALATAAAAVGIAIAAIGLAVALTLAVTAAIALATAAAAVCAASITARFAVIYEVAGNVLCYALLDSTPADVTATTGNTLTVAAHASGVFTLA